MDKYKVYSNPHGAKFWYLNGKRHRKGGPAMTYFSGYRAWFFNGKRHRVDGPAIEHCNGQKSWWISGEILSEDEYSMAVAKEDDG